MNTETLELTVRGVAVRLAYLRRAGTQSPLVCLHGFGSTKEDYTDLALREDFAGRELVFWDAPGCGSSWVSDPDALSIPFLVEVALAACDALGLGAFHLSGHSMGGLAGLMLARASSHRVLSFFDIEGNVAPEDCFLSRQIVDFPAASPDDFLSGFKDRLRGRPEYASALYVAALDSKVRPASVAPIFRSMVDMSDNAPLMDIMAGLGCPRAFVYGAQNRHLSYLGRLPDIGVEVIEIPHSGHFPMYSNPPALWTELSAFIERSEAQP
ncbi:MAG: alpha/beta hydrolase [Pseudomonadota bacterium]